MVLPVPPLPLMKMCIRDRGMELVRQQAPALAVLDLGLEPEELRKAVIDILMVNAMIHTTAVSPLTATEFHDKMEGLGMLMSLPGTSSTTLLVLLCIFFLGGDSIRSFSFAMILGVVLKPPRG